MRGENQKKKRKEKKVLDLGTRVSINQFQEGFSSLRQSFLFFCFCSFKNAVEVLDLALSARLRTYIPSMLLVMVSTASAMMVC